MNKTALPVYIFLAAVVCTTVLGLRGVAQDQSSGQMSTDQIQSLLRNEVSISEIEYIEDNFVVNQVPAWQFVRLKLSIGKWDQNPRMVLDRKNNKLVRIKFAKSLPDQDLQKEIAKHSITLSGRKDVKQFCRGVLGIAYPEKKIKNVKQVNESTWQVFVSSNFKNNKSGFQVKLDPDGNLSSYRYSLDLNGDE